MPYKYFSQELIAKNIDLSAVFPEKQQVAREQLNVSYGLGEIVIYLQDVTNNFKSQDTSYIDLDNAVQELVLRYYKSIGQDIPFEKKEQIDTYEKGVVPSEILEVKDGKIESKGVISPKEKVVSEEAVLEQPIVQEAIEEAKEQVKEEIKQEVIEDEMAAKVQKFKKSLENAELLLEDATEEEKQDTLNIFRKRLVGLELLEETGDVDEFDMARKEMISDFIKKMS